MQDMELETRKIVGNVKLWCIDPAKEDTFIEISILELKQAQAGKIWQPVAPQTECFYERIMKLQDGSFIREKIHLTKKGNKRVNERQRLYIAS
jgi:hypothetical protein